MKRWARGAQASLGQRAGHALAEGGRHGKTAILPLLAALLPPAGGGRAECGMSATLLKRQAGTLPNAGRTDAILTATRLL